MDGFEAGNTGTILDVDHNIACRTGLHCAPRVHEQLGLDKIHGAVRFGIGPFNTDDAHHDGHRRRAGDRRRPREEDALNEDETAHAHRRAERQTYAVDENGFLQDPSIWNDEVAADLATTEGIAEMTDEHWELVRYLRDYYLKFGIAPMVRKLCKETGLQAHATSTSCFRPGPANGACKVAGLPKPTGCV